MSRSLRLSHILAMLTLPMLPACGKSQEPQGPPPPSAEAQAAIRDEGGADRIALARAIDSLFDADAVGRTNALLVLKAGTVIVERYGESVDAKTRLPGWSAGQCATALMVGELVSDGRLRMDETAPVPEWGRNGDPRGEITLRQLLQMRSGLRHAEQDLPDASGTSDRTRMLFLDGRDDMAGYAEVQPLESPPGQAFRFSAATGAILADVAAEALAPGASPRRRREVVGGFIASRLFAPLGMKRTVVGFDRAGTMIGSSYIHGPARDWAQLGEFVRRSGSVAGAQIVPRRWMEAMLRPSPRSEDYGTGIWLKGEASEGNAGLALPASAPRDAFGCLGEYGQYVIGSPHQLLTVVRLGETDATRQEALRDRLGSLLALYPSNPF